MNVKFSELMAFIYSGNRLDFLFFIFYFLFFIFLAIAMSWGELEITSFKAYCPRLAEAVQNSTQHSFD